MNHKFKVTIEKQWQGMNVYLCEVTCARCDYRYFFVNKHKRPIKKEVILFALFNKVPDECKADNSSYRNDK